MRLFGWFRDAWIGHRSHMLNKFRSLFSIHRCPYIYNCTGDPPHNRAELHTTEHCAAHNRAIGTKTSGVRAFKCVTGTIVVKALFSVMVRHTSGKTNNCSEYSKVKKAICKHARLSKQICPVVCNASSVVCRAMTWAHLCSVVCSVRDQLTGLPRRLNQEHDIVLNNSTEFVFSDWS